MFVSYFNNIDLRQFKLMRALEKYTEILNKIKDSGLNIHQYCINNGISYNSLYVYVNSLKGKTDEETINFLIIKKQP